jgi:hypothetical protein
MKRLTLLSIALIALGASQGAQAQSDTLKKVADNKKITVAYRESSVPFSYLAGTAPVGFSVELSNAVVEAVKKQLKMPDLKVELQSVTSQNRIPLLQNGTIDLECGSTTNNSTRGKDVQFAINHFYTGTRLLTKKSSKITNYADLANKTVSSTTGTTNSQVMRKYNADKKLNMQIILGKDHATRCCWWTPGPFGGLRHGRHPAVRPDGQCQEPGRVGSGGRLAAGRALCLHAAQGRPEVQGAGQRRDQRHDEVRRVREALHQVVHVAHPAQEPDLNLPMSKELRDNLKAMSDKPAL